MHFSLLANRPVALCGMSDMVGQGAHKESRSASMPETRTGDEGSSKRNIQRKTHRSQHSGSSASHSQNHGQKGMWPATDDGSNYDKVALDRNDPNYDPDEDDENYILVSDSSIISQSASSRTVQLNGKHEEAPMLSLAEFKQRLGTIFEEYFLSEDLDE
eukprot:15850-Heterococcus_DN1.PRE.3